MRKDAEQYRRHDDREKVVTIRHAFLNDEKSEEDGGEAPGSEPTEEQVGDGPEPGA